MIALGLRLTLNGGKEAVARLVIIAAAVALGVGMLLITLAAINGVNSQNGRYAWLETNPTTSRHVPTADPVWWRLTADEYHGDLIGRVDVAATGPRSPVPPGISHLPGPGQYYVSPALSKLLRSTPADELGSRFPGTQIGTIGASALPAPNSLIVIVGRTVDQLSHVSGAEQVTAISTTTPSSCNGDCYLIGIDASSIDLILSIVAAALLFPLLIFIGTASRLSAARREQRFAAMRLVGATPRQVSVISTVESTIAAAVGVVVGFALFFALRPALATVPFTGERFFTSDVSLSLVDVLVIAIGVPVAAAVAARLALRRVQISPLGVTRRVTPRPPRAWRLIPLLVGLGELAWFVHAGRPATTQGQIRAFLPGILIVMAGLIIAGPWLTMLGSRLMARRTRRASVLIAGRRLSDNPKAGFRAISGLVLALFVTSVAIATITTIDAYRGGSAIAGAAAKQTIVDRFTDFSAAGPPSESVPSVPDSVLSSLQAIPGVQATTLIHANPNEDERGPTTGLVSCAQLSTIPALGRCPAGADAATINPNYSGVSQANSEWAGITWPAAAISSAQLQSLPVQSIFVRTNGSTATVERARTVLELAYPYRYSPATVAEIYAQNPNTRRNAGYQQLANVVTLTSLVIAGSSLAVSVAAGISDRKRPFSLLRLTGVPLAMLRRVVALESAVPLLVMALLSTGIGFLTAGLFLKSQLSESLQAPDVEFYLVVAAGLVLALGIIASTLPMLERITGPETARNE